MNNELGDNDLIERYLLGKLSDADIRFVESRLDDDHEFARKHRLLTTFPEMMSKEGRLEFEKQHAQTAAPVLKEKRKHFLKKRHLIWLIFFILIIGTAFVVISRLANRPKTNSDAPKETRLSSNPVKSELVPVKDTTRGKARTEPQTPEIPGVNKESSERSIELLNPGNDLKFSRNQTILFQWKQKTDTFTRFYIISELKNDVVYWRGVKPGIREYKVPASSLYPGKYYWYVGTNKEKRTFTVTE